uniref:Golgi associated, gamma adaptin ear containing, ARF binding protein 1 n=1 Tax=Phasianus colchicus TaxID=9054 RepID=A0A669QJ39_PHACC
GPAMEAETLEARINKATNPLNKELDWDGINAFCEQLNKELEGPPLATRLLAHKIQSPQEWEAIQALTVLESCMKSCGKRFHDEVGKFRFLNELIKVVSPKYLGSRTPEKVKSKILELMYSWTLGLPHEVKILEAYQMLKKQGIVKSDPKLPDDAPFPPPPPRPKNIIFDDEEKSKVRAFLPPHTAVKQGHAFPLQDQKRMEKISKRVNAIEEVNNNVKLLTEMVTNYSKGETTESNEDLMKELYQRCERMRPMLFRLASDTEDNDEALAEILQANDNLTQVINLYKQLVWGEEVNGEMVDQGNLASLLTLFMDIDISVLCFTPRSLFLSLNYREKQQPPPRLTLRDLQNRSSSGTTAQNSSVLPVLQGVSPNPPLPLNSELPAPATLPKVATTPSGSTSVPPQPPASTLPPEISLANITVPLESIKPSSILPVTVYDQHGFRILFHFAKDALPERPDVLVVVISMLSTAPQPIRNIVFQSAVPKVMKVKLQPPSGTELPAFNPIVHPSAITQVLLLANPQKEKVRLRYKLTFTMGEQTYNEMGDVDQFPPPESWGNL